jgi:phosphoribosylglycinamide formyltransferase 2
MTDTEAVKKLIATERPNYIIPEIEAIGTQALADIEKDGISTVVPNARAIQLTMNREGIRSLVADQLKLPTSKFAFAQSFDELQAAVDQGIGYPCFVKPTMSSSGKGQSMVKGSDQLQQAWDYAKTSGRVDTGKVIVEAAIDFDFEITLLTVRALNGQGVVETSFCEPIGHIQESGDYRESWQPQAMTAAAIKSAQDIAFKVTSEMGGLGLFGVELFIKEDFVWFSEVSPRPHDTGMVTMATQKQNEFELHVRAILGLPVDTGLRLVGASAVILGTSATKDVVFDGLHKALSITGCEVRLFAKPESMVNRRMGVTLTTAETVEQARLNAVQAASFVVQT